MDDVVGVEGSGRDGGGACDYCCCCGGVAFGGVSWLMLGLVVVLQMIEVG